MCNNQLKLNDDKTEAILTPLSYSHCLPSSVTVGTHEIMFYEQLDLALKRHVTKFFQTAYYVNRISSTHRYFTEDAAEQLITS